MLERSFCLPLYALLLSGCAAAAQAQESLALQPSARLQEGLSAEQLHDGVVFLFGEQLSGQLDLEALVEGHAELRKAGTVLQADRLTYDQASDLAKASGHVRINRLGTVYEGEQLQLQVQAFRGYFEQVQYQFLQNAAHGEARRVDFLDASHAVVYDASYTTCRRRPGPDWLPDWILRAARIDLDMDQDVGVADGAALYFKGVPIVPVPAISFPLSDQRKSGVLPPTLGFDSVNGSEIALPYYFNIAPNRDATLTPTVMSARGVQLGTQARYLERDYSGELRLDYLPSDLLRNSDRWALVLHHEQTKVTNSELLGTVNLALDVKRVSDDNYWRDFATTNSTDQTQRLLASSAQISWGGHGPFSGSAQWLQWQTLQDPTAPIIPPYDRVPQITARYAQNPVQGLNWSLDGDMTQFQSDSALTQQPNAQRALAWGQVSLPWRSAAGFIVPKLQLQTAAYEFDAPLGNGAMATQSTVPTFSLDSGLVLERESSLGGRSLVQTLEPRAFYVYTPYRDQSLLPNYDTGAMDFNFASIYTENAYVGHDKIADNNLLTLGATTRYLDASDGAELARLGIAQRLRFADQQVTLDSSTPPAAAGFSDVLLGGAVNLQNHWVLDSTVQYNGKTQVSDQSSVSARYNPSPYRVLNVTYRFTRNVSEQMDLSGQWPLNDLWGDRGQNLGDGRGQGAGRYYAVGRLNYSLDEQRPVQTLLGLEYDAGCWLGRLVLQRVQTSISSSTQSLMFQLEFVGFTRLGVSPLQTLTDNIARYQPLRQSGGSASRFSNYD